MIACVIAAGFSHVAHNAAIILAEVPCQVEMGRAVHLIDRLTLIIDDGLR